MMQVKYILNLREKAATGQIGQVESGRWLALGSFYERVDGVQRERAGDRGEGQAICPDQG